MWKFIVNWLFTGDRYVRILGILKAIAQNQITKKHSKLAERAARLQSSLNASGIDVSAASGGKQFWVIYKADTPNEPVGFVPVNWNRLQEWLDENPGHAYSECIIPAYIRTTTTKVSL